MRYFELFTLLESKLSHFVATGRSWIARSLIITQAIFYLFLQKLHTINYPVLQEHFKEPFRKEFTYLSPTIQNEMIDIIGKNIIQAILIDGVKKAGMHSVSADEVSSSNNEILSISEYS